MLPGNLKGARVSTTSCGSINVTEVPEVQPSVCHNRRNSINTLAKKAGISANSKDFTVTKVLSVGHRSFNGASRDVNNMILTHHDK